MRVLLCSFEYARSMALAAAKKLVDNRTKLSNDTTGVLEEVSCVYQHSIGLPFNGTPMEQAKYILDEVYKAVGDDGEIDVGIFYGFLDPEVAYNLGNMSGGKLYFMFDDSGRIQR